MDESMTQSQFDKILPPNQEGLMDQRVDKYKEAMKDFNDKLIIDNNLKDSDEGVNEGLLALEDTSYKAVGKLLKPKVIATLGFLKEMGFQEAKEFYKKVLVEDLRKELVQTYELLGPQICHDCDNMYDGKKQR